MSSLFRKSLEYASDASHWLLALRDAPHRVFLDSARAYGERGRYDIITADPIEIIKVDSIACKGYLENIESLCARITDTFCHFEHSAEIPFCGGAIGFFSYELGEAAHLDRPIDGALAVFVGIYDWAVIVDHSRQSAELVKQPTCQSSYPELLLSAAGRREVVLPGPFRLTSDISTSLDAQQYCTAFSRLQDYLLAGDCYQVNLTREFRADYVGDPLTAYLGLRKAAGAPYSAFIDGGELQLLSFSPERFLAVQDDGSVRTEPIKGTAARSSDPDEDQYSARQLLDSAKNRAENVMIVDLLRNDLGKCCKPGSIFAEPLLELQSFPTVHHLVSTVSGRLREDCTPIGALLSCFPGGSITGAPKRRAMEIIAELEPHRRDIYCGSVFYLSAGGRMDSNIIIRSFVCENGVIRGWAGGGIVADSRCDDEFRETEEKIGRLLRCLEELGQR